MNRSHAVFAAAGVAVALLLFHSHAFDAPARQQQPSRRKSAEVRQRAERADADEEVLSVETKLVGVPVVVTDDKGRYVGGLEPADFRVYENGIEQRVAFFSAAGEVAAARRPATVALMLDMSDSTKFRLREIQDAAAEFINLLPAGDRVLLVSFDKRVELLAEATDDRRVLFEAVGRLRHGGGTSLYNALAVVIDQRLARVTGRKAIVLVTDGVDTNSSGASYESSIAAVERLGAPVYTVQLDTLADAERMARDVTRATTSSTGRVTFSTPATGRTARRGAYDAAHLYLQDLAARTGARLVHARSVKELGQSFARVAELLGHQYQLSYYPSEAGRPGERRKIEVRVSAKDARVRARPAYVVPRPPRS